MKKIEIENQREIMKELLLGRVVEGRLMVKEDENGRCYIAFVQYNRKKRKRYERTICELDGGWLKETAKLIVLRCSKKKSMELADIVSSMQRDLDRAMVELAFEKELGIV